MPLTVRVVFAVAVLCSSVAAAQDRPDDVLRPLTTCSFGKDLKPDRVDRWRGAQPWRMVQTSSGPMQVSIADGYRMLLGFGGGAPFVNLKLERSQPGKLAQDRTAILAQMTSFAAQPGAAVAPFKVVARNGIEIMALNNRSLDGGSVIGIYTLISEKDRLIATAYLLNQKPAQRKFKNYREYQALRDDFIYALALCMAEL
jgi:hypothetical protein